MRPGRRGSARNGAPSKESSRGRWDVGLHSCRSCEGWDRSRPWALAFAHAADSPTWDHRPFAKARSSSVAPRPVPKFERGDYERSRGWSRAGESFTGAGGRGRRATVGPKRETTLPLPVRFLAAWIGVWLGRYQQQLIEYQREEIQLLRQNLGSRQLGHVRQGGVGATPLQRWGSATTGGVGKEARTQGSWSGCHGGDAGYDPSLVPRTGGEEVRWQRQTRAGATRHRCRRRPPAGVDG